MLILSSSHWLASSILGALTLEVQHGSGILGTATNGMKIRSSGGPSSRVCCSSCLGLFSRVVFLGSAFDGPGFDAVGTVGPVCHERSIPAVASRQTRARRVPRVEPQIGSHGVQPCSTVPAKLSRCRSCPCCLGRLPHQSSDQIVGQQMHEDFLADDIRHSCRAAICICMVVLMSLNRNSTVQRSPYKRGDLLHRIGHRIQQRRGDHDRPASKSGNLG